MGVKSFRDLNTFAAADENMKVTDTSLLLVLSHWLDEATTFPSTDSNGFVSGKPVHG